MAETVYSGSSSTLDLGSVRTISVSGGSGAQDYINYVTTRLWMSTNAYSNYYNVTVILANSGGTTLATANRTDIKFTADNYGGAYWDFDFSTGFDVNAIASVKVSAASDGSKIFVKNDPSSKAAYVYVGYTVYTACGAPSSAYLGASLSESDPAFYWSGAAGGAANGITGYEIEYAESSNNSTWGAWTALKTISTGETSGSTTVTISGTRGYYRKYRIRTQGSAGASYYSGWVETGSCRRNSTPTALTSFAATPAVYVSGSISLSYSGATDADNNIVTYNVQYATSANGSSWSGWTSIADGSTSHTPTLSPGHYIKYQARPIDAFSQASAWTASNVCGKNTAPADPTINYPQTGKTIYNSRPRFLITLGADPESHTMTLAAAGYTLSRSSGLVGGSKIIARPTSAQSAGTVSISATATDQYAESSGAVTRDTTYAVASFTDAMVEAGTTPIKAAHVTEIRTMVNTIRAYYGLSAVSWSETITAGVTKSRGWKTHVIELQQAINDVVVMVNGWDAVSTVNQIAAFTWISPGAKPSAEVMNQLRQVIAWL